MASRSSPYDYVGTLPSALTLLSPQLKAARFATLDTCPKEDWIVRVGPAVQDRISRYPEGELLFNLLAIVPQRSPPDPALLDIARRRKVDYEAFTHRALSILGRKSMAQIYLSDD